jgi:hypothetical protein
MVGPMRHGARATFVAGLLFACVAAAPAARAEEQKAAEGQEGAPGQGGPAQQSGTQQQSGTRQSGTRQSGTAEPSGPTEQEGTATDVRELDGTTHYFLGARYRGVILP